MVHRTLIVVAALLCAGSAIASMDCPTWAAGSVNVCNEAYPKCTYPGPNPPDFGMYQCSNADGTATVKATCDEAASNLCHHEGFCDVVPTEGNWALPKFHCCCPEGLVGRGYGEDGCTRNGYEVRIVLKLDNPTVVGNNKLEKWKELRDALVQVLYPGTTMGENFTATTVPAYFYSSIFHEVADGYVSVSFLYQSETGADGADAAKAAFNTAVADGVSIVTSASAFGTIVLSDADGPTDALLLPGVLDGEDQPPAQKYVWSNDDTRVLPVGLEVTGVFFDTTCEQSGCWVVDVIFTVGENGFNVFYLPKSEVGGDGDDDLSYDWTYPDGDYGDIYEPANFPCLGGNGVGQDRRTACCLAKFDQLYRPVETLTYAAMLNCSSTDPEDYSFDQPEFGTAHPDVEVANMPASALVGNFSGMSYSYVEVVTPVDLYIGQYTARIRLDEVELRRNAGILRGTVGVEHTVDTFIGYANFKPTSGTGTEFVSEVLDALASQSALHLEKTSFFSVSTHGVNDYTFLEYINLRLVTIYNADLNGEEEADEQGTRTTRTNSTNAAQYVQVTFTLGSKYTAHEDGLVPPSSVRVGKGVFMDDDATDMFHTCSLYNAPNNKVRTFDGSEISNGVFGTRLTQPCGPGATMCANPTQIPDNFASINLPLGMDWLDEPSSQLDHNVFVSMVISAIDTVARGDDGSPATNPNGGDAPWQMKTTLTASIPVVDGGLNIFCDSITAKTDLKDVANVDIVVGSAADANELTRLRILQDLATTALSPTENTATIDSASIEAGLMTFVLKGNASYFVQGSTTGYSMELEDVITIHIMEPEDTVVKKTEVDKLLAQAGEDNFDNNALDTDGYYINGAFYFRITRDDGRAHLEPSPALLAECPFNPPRPTSGVTEETCVIRRDVKDRVGQRRTGAAFDTAIEIPALGGSDSFSTPTTTGNGDGCDVESDGTYACRTNAENWLKSIFGDSDYTEGLAQKYSYAIAERYDLNARYRRAYWINPGYEWTPTQTNGQSIFTVSQRIYLFALVSLDENWDTTTRRSMAGKRRMLLQTGGLDAEPASASSGMSLAAPISRKDIMASAFGVPADQVATFTVVSQLTEDEACMSVSELAAAQTKTFTDLFSTAASEAHTVQAVVVSRDLNGHVCKRRRAARGLLAAFTEATVESKVMVVFKEANPKVNMAALRSSPGIKGVPAVDAVVTDDSEFEKKADSDRKGGDDDDSSSSNTALIAGAVGGAIGGLLIIAAGVFFMRKKSADQATAQVVQPAANFNAQELKNQLADV